MFGTVLKKLIQPFHLSLVYSLIIISNSVDGIKDSHFKENSEIILEWESMFYQITFHFSQYPPYYFSYPYWKWTSNHNFALQIRSSYFLVYFISKIQADTKLQLQPDDPKVLQIITHSLKRKLPKTVHF